MGNLGSIRLAAHGNQTPITPSYIYFLDNRFHPLATSQKVCDAWQRQSEAKGKWHSARRWSTRASKRASARKTWRIGSDATNPLLPVLKAVSAGSTLSNWSFWRVPSALIRSSFWRSLKPPRSLTTGFEFSRSDDHSLLEDQLANIKETRRAVVVNALQPHAAIRSATVQEVSKQ